MTWAEFRAATLLLAEERIGRRLRERQREEDAQLARSIEGLRQAGSGTR